MWLDYPGNNPFSRTRLTKRGWLEEGGGPRVEPGIDNAALCRRDTTRFHATPTFKRGRTNGARVSTRFCETCPRPLNLRAVTANLQRIITYMLEIIQPGRG